MVDWPSPPLNFGTAVVRRSAGIRTEHDGPRACSRFIFAAAVAVARGTEFLTHHRNTAIPRICEDQR
ncbi:MAG: hypothetical protein D6725_04515 [Planctomycetota bacterium]|nr:MAG: hypothetical protein D6725_04515 [Planctomycetota bacterium]